MTKKSIKKRLKITKRGKVKHRVPGQGHNKSNKKKPQRSRKKGKRELNVSRSKVRELINN